jgi:hypothetical protein
MVADHQGGGHQGGVSSLAVVSILKGAHVETSASSISNVTAGAAVLPAASRIAWAETYPAQPVNIIVGFPAGRDRHHGAPDWAMAAGATRRSSSKTDRAPMAISGQQETHASQQFHSLSRRRVTRRRAVTRDALSVPSGKEN